MCSVSAIDMDRARHCPLQWRYILFFGIVISAVPQIGIGIDVSKLHVIDHDCFRHTNATVTNGQIHPCQPVVQEVRIFFLVCSTKLPTLTDCP